MSDNAVTLLDVDDQRWASFVAREAAATFFHHPAWARAVAECYGYRARAAVLFGEAGEIAAGVPLIEVVVPIGGRRWVALPFSDHCPPLGVPAARGVFLRALAERAARERVRSVELRDAASVAEGFTPRDVAVRHTLEVPATAALAHERLGTMHQRNIRKALRAGVRVVHGRDRGALETFYRLHTRTRRRLGVPTQPRRFFGLLQTHALDAGHGFVLTAMRDDAPIASAVFLAWNGVLIYKYGASDERSWEHRPNNLLLWRAIEHACETGMRVLDLGRSDLGDTGLRAFKDGWGATERPLSYAYTSAAAGAARTRPLAERALGVVIRRSHPWVSRAFGELLYRYAA